MVFTAGDLYPKTVQCGYEQLHDLGSSISRSQVPSVRRGPG